MMVIVSGLPRSGTSMMMRMLLAGGLPVLTDQVRGADIDNPGGYYEFEPVKKTAENPQWLEQAAGKAVKMVYKLLYDLPPGRSYHVIFMLRTLSEVVASQDRMLARLGRREAGDAASAHDLVGTLAAEVAAARGWLARQPNFQVAYVNYNHLLADPAPRLAGLAEFLPVPLDLGAMQAVIDPALYRRRA